MKKRRMKKSFPKKKGEDIYFVWFLFHWNRFAETFFRWRRSPWLVLGDLRLNKLWYRSAVKGTYLGARRALLWFSNQIMRYMWLLLLNIEFNLFDRTISFQLWPMTTTSSVASVKSMLPSSHGQLHRMMVRWLDMEKYDKVCFSQVAQVLFFFLIIRICISD